MKGLHIVTLLVGLVIGYAIGARFPGTVPVIGKAQ